MTLSRAAATGLKFIVRRNYRELYVSRSGRYTRVQIRAKRFDTLEDAERALKPGQHVTAVPR